MKINSSCDWLTDSKCNTCCWGPCGSGNGAQSWEWNPGSHTCKACDLPRESLYLHFAMPFYLQYERNKSLKEKISRDLQFSKSWPSGLNNVPGQTTIHVSVLLTGKEESQSRFQHTFTTCCYRSFSALLRIRKVRVGGPFWDCAGKECWLLMVEVHPPGAYKGPHPDCLGSGGFLTSQRWLSWFQQLFCLSKSPHVWPWFLKVHSWNTQGVNAEAL